MFTRRGIGEVVHRGGHGVAVQPFEPDFGVLFLVVGGFGEDVGDLDVSVLHSLRRVIGILVAGLAFPGEGGHQIGLGAAPFEFHRYDFLSC